MDRHPQGRATVSWRSPPTGSGGAGTDRGACARWASPSRPASGPPTPRAGFFWIYAPVRFDDHALVTIVQERPSGERIMQDAHRVFPLGSGREAEWLGRPEHELRFAPGTRSVTGATLSYYGAHGQKTAEVEVETLLAFPLLLGSGYGLEPDWKHGMYQGDLVVQGQHVPPADPSYSTWALTEYAARFTYDGQVGYGMFECAVMGPHQQYGFTGWMTARTAPGAAQTSGGRPAPSRPGGRRSSRPATAGRCRRRPPRRPSRRRR